MITVTINAMMTHEEESSNDDLLSERGIDIELPDDVDHRQVMTLLFDGFVDRLKASGIEVGHVANFT